jgi:hypothetical protein
LWFEERASSDAALTKPLEIENAHSTLLTYFVLTENAFGDGTNIEEGAFSNATGI